MKTKRIIITDLINRLRDKDFSETLVNSYFKDTGYLLKDIKKREIEIPQQMLSLYLKNDRGDALLEHPRGKKVAILLPRNGINIVVAKAVMASCLSGNYSIIKLPRKLINAYPVYKSLFEDHIPYLELSDREESSQSFLEDCMRNPMIHSVIIYGDDKWIPHYWEIAKATKTKLFFEGPGKDPQVVMPDADIDKAVQDAVICGLVNGGQSCSAFERFYVHHSLYDQFVVKLDKKLSELQIGDPQSPSTDIGPVSSPQVIKRVLSQIDEALKKGAKLLRGGKLRWIESMDLYAIEPAILTNCSPDMRIVYEESFAPVFPILHFESTASLITILDKTNYGLNASVYGTAPTALRHYIESCHRKVFYDSTVVSPVNEEQRLVDGGYKNSGFIWEWKDGNYQVRHGSRLLLDELYPRVLQREEQMS